MWYDPISLQLANVMNGKDVPQFSSPGKVLDIDWGKASAKEAAQFAKVTHVNTVS